MIQRIQTLYLSLAAVALATGLLTDWATYMVVEEIFVLSGSNSTVDSISQAPLMLALVVGLALCVVTILMFKRRNQQLKFINIIWIQMVLILVMFSWVHYQNIEMLKSRDVGLKMGYAFGVVTPLIAVVLAWMAKRAIKKDEELVRSVDRLR